MGAFWKKGKKLAFIVVEGIIGEEDSRETILKMKLTKEQNGSDFARLFIFFILFGF